MFMKKLLYIFTVVLLSGIIYSCQGDEVLQQDFVLPEGYMPVSFTFSAPDMLDVDTKGVDPDGKGVNSMILFCFDNFGMYRDDAVVYPNVPRANMFIGNFLRLEILRRECAYEKLIEECKSFLLIPAKTNSCLWENRIERDDLKYRIKGSCCHGFAAIAGCFLTEALTGFRGFSSDKKEIYVTGKHVEIDAEFTLPIDDKVMKVINENGKVTFEVPEGYKIIGI